MTILLKRVRVCKVVPYDIILCENEEGFYINVSEGEEYCTVIRGIDNFEKAIEQFLRLVWEMS